MGSLDWKLFSSHDLHPNRSGNLYIANKLLEFSHEIVLANNVSKIPHLISTLLYECVSSRLSGFSEKANIDLASLFINVSWIKGNPLL